MKAILYLPLQQTIISKVYMVPEAGLEPAHLAAGDFESPASTNSATRATHEVSSDATRHSQRRKCRC